MNLFVFIIALLASSASAATWGTRAFAFHGRIAANQGVFSLAHLMCMQGTFDRLHSIAMRMFWSAEMQMQTNHVVDTLVFMKQLLQVMFLWCSSWSVRGQGLMWGTRLVRLLSMQL
jgi:hypothetical protein